MKRPRRRYGVEAQFIGCDIDGHIIEHSDRAWWTLYSQFFTRRGARRFARRFERQVWLESREIVNTRVIE